jgi:type VI secretion system protein ImpL
MQSIFQVLKSRYFWMGVGIAALVALTFIVGQWMGWTLVTQLYIVIGLLVVFTGIIVVEFVRARQSAQQIEQSIKMQAEQQRKSTRPDKQAEIEELQERLEEAIGKLKQSKLGRGRRGRNALHALPWYMFIGPPAAGKTTAIKNSGLNFPVGTDGVRGVGGTRNCDWFFTDQAILLDTAGRYMTEREDEEEWHAFLDMLKEHRRQRPINGVIIGISIEELIDAAPDEIEWHANTIRRRTSELVERLGVRFPVYVVFTKCDLLQGFVEFFGDMTHQQREQIWGCTLTEEQRHKDNLRRVFEREFGRLYNALVDVRSERLSRSMKREERRSVYIFPLEFASAKQNLSLFIDQLFQQNPYQENPEFRGFYFTSGTQEGAPIDRVIQSLAQEFDLARQPDDRSEPPVDTKSYFIKDIFTDVVIPDQYMVEQTSQSARRGRFMQLGIGVASAVLLAVFAIIVLGAYWTNSGELDDVEAAARTAATVRWDGRNPSADLQRIRDLKQEIDALEESQAGWFGLASLRLDRSGTVLGPARNLYYQTVRPLMRNQIQTLQERIRSQVQNRLGTALNPDQHAALHDDLKAYLLLSDQRDRLREASNRSFLVQHLVETAMRSGNLVAQASKEGRSGQVENQIAAFIEGLAQNRVEPFEASSSLVRNARRSMDQAPTLENIYARIKQEGMRELDPTHLREFLQEAPVGVSAFSHQPEVPGFFTKRGWRAYVQDRIEQEAEDPGGEEWVLGKESPSLVNSFQDPEQLTVQLEQRYFQEYAAAWERFLRQISYRSFSDIRGTSEMLRAVGDPFNSPLTYVLGRVTKQTTFEGSQLEEAGNQVADELEQRGKQKARSRLKTRGALQGSSSENGEASMHPVNRRMIWLHRLNADRAVSGGASPALTQSMRALQDVGRLLETVTNNPARSVEVAKQVLNENGGDLGAKLRSIQNNLGQFDPETRRELFERPLRAAWEVILQSAQSHLNDRWADEVSRPFQQHLAGRYPFDPGSSQDAPIVRFRDFFHPQSGHVATFYRDRLAPFLRDGRYRPKTWEGRGLDMSATTVQMMKQVGKISRSLFTDGRLQLSFELQPDMPRVTEGNTEAERVFLRIHGTSAPTYRLGFRPRQTFRWPGQRDGANLSIRTSDGTPEKQFNGRWAWFRMLQDAEIEQRSATEYLLQWRLSDDGQYTIVANYTLFDQQATDAYLDIGGLFRFTVPKTID